MNIEIGKYYDNKTWRFLLPCLKGHGDIFINRFNTVFKLAVGIHDTLLDGSYLSEGRNLYILCNKDYQKKNFSNFINWMQYKSYYKGDYCPDANFKTTKKHMLIIKVPKTFNNAYDYFLKSEYSKMYSEEELSSLFSVNTKEYQVLSKSIIALPNFVKKVNKRFDVNMNPNIFKDKELELPLERHQEIFNCEKNQRVYFNEELDKVWKS